MKIGIVTVYNTHNCGSFLQAFSLQHILKKRNHDVYFIKRKKPIRTGFGYSILQAVKSTIKNDFAKSKNIIRNYIHYKHIQKCFAVEKNTLCDLLIYGSDTIWNFESAYFKKNWKRYWGYGVKQKKITYAASAGSTKEHIITERAELADCAKEFSGISVRDDNTYNIVRKLLPENKKVVRVIDPTMLLEPQDYQNLEEHCNEDNFILVYAFNDMPEGIVNQVRRLAKEEGKKVIAFGDRKWADVTLNFEPRYMLGYFRKADYIITNTFHGTVFSILFNKNFAAYGKGKKKVESLLGEFGLFDRLVDDDGDITSVLKNQIDYEIINKVLAAKRKESLEYLDVFLK